MEGEGDLRIVTGPVTKLCSIRDRSRATECTLIETVLVDTAWEGGGGVGAAPLLTWDMFE